jgi:hypothetical protein
MWWRGVYHSPVPYQVPMIEVGATVALAGLEPEEHFLFLSPYSERRDGPETLADYLNSHRRFYPMVVAGAPKMVNRDQILWLRCERLLEMAELDATIITRLTIVELSDGSRLEGTIPIDRPREYSRISDVLNDDTELFLRIDGDEETWYVNKLFIRSVIPR